MEKYFNNLRPGCVVYMQGGNVVDLSVLPSNSFELYCSGFKHLSLKPAAKELFAKCSREDIESFIEIKTLEKRMTDVEILKEVLNPKKRTKDKDNPVSIS